MSALETLIIIFGLLNLAFAGFIYAHSDRRPVISFYALISVFASLWSVATLLTATGLSLPHLELAMYGHYIFGYLAYLSFFWFALYFPRRAAHGVPFAVLLTLATFGFLALIPTEHIMFTVQPGIGLAGQIVFNFDGYIAFILMLSAVFAVGLIVLLVRLHRVPKTDLTLVNRGQLNYAILSNLVAGTLGIVLNLLFPLYGNFDFFYVNPIFVTLALIGFGLYNLLHLHLFNVKLVLTEFFTASVWIIAFVELLSSKDLNSLLTNSVILVAWVFFGMFLIRSVLREIRAREEIQKLAQQLEETNARQETLIHFIGHEVKNFLSKAQNAFSLLGEGEFGQLPPEAAEIVKHGLADTQDGVASVSDILKASNLKKGTVSFKREPFDLKAVAAAIVEKSRQAAEAKGLKFSFTADGGDFHMQGDQGEIADHVLRNLVDNAVNYTPAGSVDVSLTRETGKYVFRVKDTGVGISDEDKAHLFTEGGHGKESQKINVHSTGYGLFIAKQVTEAHEGTISAASDGPGKGSTFTVEFPA